MEAEIRREKRRLFRQYLDGAELCTLDGEQFEKTRRHFVARNTGESSPFPGPIICAEDAYLDEEYGNLFQQRPKPRPPCCGLPAALLETLFLLQHVAYRDEVLKNTRKIYRANRTHFPGRNRKILQSLREIPDDWYAARMVDWAESRGPLLVRDRVRILTKYTPGRPGSLRFFGVNGGFLGSHEPYQVDRSHGMELDVFGA